MGPFRRLLVLLAALDESCAADALPCGHCLAISESIHRSINLNISAFEREVHLGTQRTATIEIGQIIWHLCGSDAWKSQRYSEALDASCAQYVRPHVDMMTNFWKEHAADTYKDPAFSLRMKRAVCTHADLGSCERAQLPNDYAPLRPDECAVCEAVVADLFGVVRFSRERPVSSKNDNYFRLVGLMGAVCEELPMRHAIMPQQLDNVRELCEDFWEEHEATLYKLALERSASFAARVCSTLDVCAHDMRLETLYAHDPTGAPKDEL